MSADNTMKKSVSLTEQAYLALREQVITCELAPGTDVSEKELAERLAMSKTPVREAMGRLCLEGLMESFPRRGYRVSPVTVKDMNDLFAVRGILEGAAAALAAQNLTDQELDQLAQLAKAEYVVGEGHSTKGFVASNEMFHAAIARGSKNPRLHSLIMSHLEEGTRFLYMGTRARDVNFETHSDHNQIVTALRTRNGETARQAMLDHNEHTREGLLQALISQTELSVTF
ncbi:putative HTH-type transcriptional regulator in unstable DNA locus (plasmid) [Maritalea myrionectae]|uniref:Putative HTH-type transcriptional regulator in unstable DNA locus n=1 Tax=Maritalea myrionectae TaxID=454601 RepID=A0A2R4MJP0_9HYPH|nr:GntR family transcriptional regulator [Maritalea myrionectae]AVX06193.1 putative HTH-type transcriptional regulator in unstable DNA locus [Maritalea myrionectae]